MIAPRNGINAVVRGELAYLCGGDNSGTVEVYDGVKGKFVLLRLKLPFVGGCVAAGLGDSILCIAAEASVWWHVREERVLEKHTHPHCRVSCICPPLITGSHVYVAATLECRVYSLSSGELLRAWR
jgi:hypothetical protein